jgi:2-polyprenyl-6-methoxyphenol hydroxylase-like FAD-dependent oxidoreductase
VEARLDIGVVGCGTAGAAAAVFLARAGHAVTLVERVPQPGPIGAGIVMQPSGLAVLRRLGLDGPVCAAGARLDGLRCRAPTHTLFALRYERLAAGAFGLGLHRGVLFQVLFDALAPAGVTLVLGHAATRLEADGDRHYLRLGGAGRVGPFDLVIVADGARSSLREQVVHEGLVRRYPYGALWFVGEIGERAPRELVQAVAGTREMMGILPTGTGPEHEARGALGSLFFSIAERDVVALKRGSLDAFKDHVRRRLPEAHRVVEQIHDFDQLLFAAYHDVVLPRWHDRGVVLLGDAAHATSPQLGQGCNLALVDAGVLASSIEQHARLPDALTDYAHRRRATLAFYQRSSRWLTPFFQSDDAGLGPLRDLFFPILSRMPFFERRMLETMAGLSTGWLSADPLG